MRSTALPALLGAVLSACAGIVAAAPTAATPSTLFCKDYVPFGPNYGEPTGNVEFTVSKRASLLPALRHSMPFYNSKSQRICLQN